MGNNELVLSTSKNGILKKIKSMFISLFGRKKNVVEEVSNDVEKHINNSSEQNFMNDLKDKTDNVSKEETLEYVIDEVKKDSQKLDKLTTEQLEEINEYYDKEIQKVEEKINKLKKCEN